MFYAIFVPDENFNSKVFDLFLAKGADPKDKEINKQSLPFYLARDGNF